MFVSKREMESRLARDNGRKENMYIGAFIVPFPIHTHTHTHTHTYRCSHQLR